MQIRDSHKRNKRIIALMLFIFSLGFILFIIGGCSAMRLSKDSSKKIDTEKVSSTASENKHTQQFDFSTISQEDFKLTYLPINPYQSLRVSTKNDGSTVFENAYPVYESSSRQENKNIEIKEAEAKTTTAQEERLGIQEETHKRKLKFSIPWYAYLILGFFGFATLLGFFFIYRLTKNITAISKQLTRFQL